MNIKEFKQHRRALIDQFGQQLAEGQRPAEYLKAIAPLMKYSKIVEEARFTTAIVGDWLAEHPEWKAPVPKAPAPKPTNPDLGVFADHERHTCIRLKLDKKGVTFIPMDSSLEVCTLPHKEFEMRYTTHLKDYPVKQATRTYLGASWLVVSPAAKRHLETIVDDSFVDTVEPTNFENKESIMTVIAFAAPAKKAASKSAGTKAAPAKKADKAAPAKKATKVDAPKAAKAAAKGAAAIKPRKYDDNAKIKVLNKENPHREGSGRAEAFDAIVGSKTMGDYYASGHKIKYVEGWVESGHITVG